MALKVLSALDSAKTQWYHFKAIIIAGMGIFTDAYDLFCITLIMQLLGPIYYRDKANVPAAVVSAYVPAAVVSAMVGIGLLGTVIGQLVFGRLGDLMGRRRVYGLALMLMVLSSLGCGFSICIRRPCVLASLGFFRFLLGVGIGGDYPLSATIMSEFANKRTRGGFIAAVFSLQGIGIVASSTVTIIVCKIFEASSSAKHHTDKTPSDIAWRLILMIGAIPAALTYYWRMMMPETARYTALVEQNVVQAAKDMEKVMDVSMSQIAEDEPVSPGIISPVPPYPLLSREFFRRHGRDLFACSASWFLVDIVFYSSNLFQSDIYKRFVYRGPHVNAYEYAFKVARLQAIIAVCSTLPGYWFTVYFIDRVGRVKIQIMGFFFMAVVYVAIGISYPYWDMNKENDHNNALPRGFMVLYGLTFFFANFGPNATTFIVPAELFPARFRSTCHGIAGAMGKVGAIIGCVGFLWASHPKGIGMKKSLVILGGVCVVGMLVTYLFTLETKGRSLEENEKEDDEAQGRFFLRPCFIMSGSRRHNRSISISEH